MRRPLITLITVAGVRTFREKLLFSLDRSREKGGREGGEKKGRTFWNVGQSARQIGYKQATQQILEFLIVSPIREDGFGDGRGERGIP